MKENPTGTDIRYIAKGYWTHRFKWGFPHRAKTALVVALVSFLAGLAVAGADIADMSRMTVATNSSAVAGATNGPSAITFVAGALVLVAAGFFIYGMAIAETELGKFLDSVTARWEAGDKSIPDADTVARFLDGIGR